MFYRLSEHETHFNFLTKFKFYPKLGKLGEIYFKRLNNKFSLFYTFLYPIFASSFILLYISRSRGGTVWTFLIKMFRTFQHVFLKRVK